MKKIKKPGSEHFKEIKNDFLDNLKRNWPESKDQIHCGGWKTTKDLVKNFPSHRKIRVLDICCGEGATCMYIAKHFNADVYGIDIIEKSIVAAASTSFKKGLNKKVFFTHGNIFELPYENNFFDFVIGQDPDGLCHKDRVIAFKEIFRVLKRTGTFVFHHWILGLGANAAIKSKFDFISSRNGFNSFQDLNAEAYLRDLIKSGFPSFRYIDKSKEYNSHMNEIKNKSKGNIDYWTKEWLKLAGQHKLGIMIYAVK